MAADATVFRLGILQLGKKRLLGLVMSSTLSEHQDLHRSVHVVELPSAMQSLGRAMNKIRSLYLLSKRQKLVEVASRK
jgi:hypothetical protein